MAVPDHEIDEPSDADWCEIHIQYRPCEGCKDDANDRRHDDDLSA